LGIGAKRIAIAVGLVCLLLAAWLLWPKKPLDDEAMIREAIARMCEQAGKKDVGGIVEHVSDSYHGEAGDKRELKSYLLGYLLRSGMVAAVPARVEVQVKGERAQVVVVVLLARTPAKKAEEVGPDQLMGSHRIEAEFVKEAPGIWRALNATRRDAAPQDLLP
jgi:hypothetical protein